MTRTARAPRLNQHIAEPFVEIHPDDAARLGIGPATLVRLRSAHGQMVARALLTDRVRMGDLFAPMHWSAAWSSAGRVDATVAPHVDPISGQPELKGTVVAVEPLAPAWYGFAAVRNRPDPAELDGLAYWALAATATGWKAELAGMAAPGCWASFARRLTGAPPDSAVIVMTDTPDGRVRLAVTAGKRTLGVLYTDRGPVEVARSHVVDGLTGLPPQALLAARAGADRPDPGAIVCSCLDVGVNTIATAIAERRLATVEEIGAATGAGTNCGSCRPELQALLSGGSHKVAAE